MADNAARIAKLEDALASGVLTVESDGERVTYHSRGDILKAINYLRSTDTGTVGSGRLGTTLATFGCD